MKTVHAATKDAVFQASIEFIGALTGMTPPPIEIAPAETFKPFADFTNLVCEIFEKQIIVELTKERDAYEKCADTMASAHKVERDALKEALDKFSEAEILMNDVLRKQLMSCTSERDALELRIGAMIVERSDAFFKVIQERDAYAKAADDMAASHKVERDALQSAARMALDALESTEPYINTTATACRGDKCREPWCSSCNTEEDAEESAGKGWRAAVKALSTIAALKAVL